jgi:hypothetical protein
MYGRGEYRYSDGQSVHGYFVNGRMISEKNMMAAAQSGSSFRTSRKLGNTPSNLFQIPENDDQFNGMDFVDTKKEWADASQMRDFPRNMP